MSFTGSTSLIPHLYFAREISGCWGDIHQATFDESFPPNYGNEVSTFFIMNNLIYLYYNHYVYNSSGYATDTFSLRITLGVMYSNGSIAGFTPAVLNPSSPGFNTFVLWANNGSPDKLYSVNGNYTAINCYPPTEPSVFMENATSFYLSLGCLEFTNLTFTIRMIHANNPAFQNATSRLLINFQTFCPTRYNLGWQAGSIININGVFFLTPSPLAIDYGTYHGCVFYTFLNNSLANPLNTTPVFEVLLGHPHSGSCTGGAGSLNPIDQSTTNTISLFHCNNLTANPVLYNIYEINLSGCDVIIHSASTTLLLTSLLIFVGMVSWHSFWEYVLENNQVKQ